ncbi:hypothetical protein PSQ90_06085 [Devosia rhodophyticola]|uniref:Uncharacterized protein n=1 Tax=Devosia rhodophyticola TaxID=3026423 RepID=A0ABY7Z1Y7_9HYPH|nr:hypothetical protein [Devosia rhodophyticola]WDR07005.1 hypothetical protein PSQ90_06085 [Devosia rhodophyticola]
MKGWMQTFVVHNRRPHHLRRDLGWGNFIAFEAMVGGMILSPLLHSAYIIATLTRLFMGLPFSADFDHPWHAVYLLVIILGYAAPLIQTWVGLIRLGHVRLLIPQLLLPLYWIFVSWATLRAIYELLDRPFYWAKTRHRVVPAKRQTSLVSILNRPNAASRRWRSFHRRKDRKY